MLLVDMLYYVTRHDFPSQFRGESSRVELSFFPLFLPYPGLQNHASAGGPAWLVSLGRNTGYQHQSGRWMGV